MESNSQIIIYQAENGQTKLEVRLENETVWLNQAQLADLFQTDRTSIVKHIGNIYDSGELNEKATCAKIAQVQKEGEEVAIKRVFSCSEFPNNYYPYGCSEGANQSLI